MLRTQSSAVRELLKYSKMPNVISLAGGIPAPDLFDIPGLEGALDEEISEHNRDSFQYGITEGEPRLRQQIVAFMLQRGIRTTAENVLVTAGSQQGLDLIARVFLNPGDTILVERPAYLAALQVFTLAEARMLSVPTDEQGINVEQVEAILSNESVKAIYLVPNFGNPSGCTLTFERRQRLVQLACRYRVLIIEDDPYGEIRLQGEHIPSLYEIAQGVPGAEDSVLYLSSFSKILAPGLRTGWMVVPGEVYGHLAVAKQAIDLHTCTLSQRIIERYMASGRLQPRLSVLRASYRERRDALCAALRRHLGNAIQFNTPDGGMFLWGCFTSGVDASMVLKHAINAGVVFVPGEPFFFDAPERNTLRLSYSTITPASADEAARRLATALHHANSH
jgi:DNA-binding transcriptional MocR family regulator